MARPTPARSRRARSSSASLTLSLTNPKAILFYVSFFVQFIDVNAKAPGVAFFILALTLEVISFCYMSFFDPLRLVCHPLR